MSKIKYNSDATFRSISTNEIYYSGTTLNNKYSAYKQISDFNSTPLSNSAITMTTDQTSNIKAGYALKYKIENVDYYGVCTSISSNELDIAGAPLYSAITELYYSSNMSEMVSIIIPGTFEDAADNYLILHDLKTSFRWDKTDAALVRISNIVITDDSGANQPHVNVVIGGPLYENLVPVCNSNSDSGMTVAESWTNTDININTTNYSIKFGDFVDIKVDSNGSNKDASDLTIQMIFVYKK